MKKYIVCLFFFILLFNIGCQKIELRKIQKETPPFSWKPGTLEIKLYRVEYPQEIFEKERFFLFLDDAFTKMYLYKNKVSVIFDENFYYDYKSIEKGEFILGEELFYKSASSLTKEEKLNIKKVLKKDILKYKGTAQEYLNLQVLFWLRAIDKENEFEEEKLYTELDKEKLITYIRNKRINMIKKLSRIKLEMIIEILDYYSLKDEINKEYMSKKIIFDNKYNYSKKIENYNMPVVIKNMKEEDIENTVNDDISFKNKIVIIDNKYYSGYKLLKGEIIIYYGGEKKLKGIENYNIDVKIINSSLEKIININNDNSLSSIFGGK